MDVYNELAKFQYTLTEIKPNIFHLSFGKDKFALAMAFLRAQEFYESPNPQFKGTKFRILDFIEWYSKNQNDFNSFTYADDWAGFNVPSWVLDKLYFGIGDLDINKYDYLMEQIYYNMKWKLRDESLKGTPFYLIGSSEGDKETLKHEIAHGFYYLNPEYKQEMQNLISEIPENIKKKIVDWLSENMYHEDVFDDEIQAYFSTGLVSELKRNYKPYEIHPITKQFKKVFEKYYNK